MAASLQLMKAMMSAQDELAPKIDVQLIPGTIKIALAISEEGVKKMMAAAERNRTGTRSDGPSRNRELGIHPVAAGWQGERDGRVRPAGEEAQPTPP